MSTSTFKTLSPTARQEMLVQMAVSGVPSYLYFNPWTFGATVRARPPLLSPLRDFHRKSVISMAVLYGRAGRLAATNDGFRPGQMREHELLQVRHCRHHNPYLLL